MICLPMIGEKAYKATLLRISVLVVGIVVLFHHSWIASFQISNVCLFCLFFLSKSHWKIVLF